jgi:hypothetical protein
LKRDAQVGERDRIDAFIDEKMRLPRAAPDSPLVWRGDRRCAKTTRSKRRRHCRVLPPTDRDFVLAAAETVMGMVMLLFPLSLFSSSKLVNPFRSSIFQPPSA